MSNIFDKKTGGVLSPLKHGVRRIHTKIAIKQIHFILCLVIVQAVIRIATNIFNS